MVSWTILRFAVVGEFDTITIFQKIYSNPQIMQHDEAKPKFVSFFVVFDENLDMLISELKISLVKFQALSLSLGNQTTVVSLILLSKLKHVNLRFWLKILIAKHTWPPWGSLRFLFLPRRIELFDHEKKKKKKFLKTMLADYQKLL